jgi:UDP-GlcNAc:undecaprenyl-phosphate GlcNAc-1-phosphate transferase
VRIFTSIYLLIVSFLLSIWLVPVAKRVAFKFNILDNPGTRKIHTSPKPYLGGIAIYLSFFIVIAFNIILFLIVKDSLFFQQKFHLLYIQYPLLIKTAAKLFAVIFGGTIIAIIGLIDDIKGIEFSPLLKLMGQVFVAFFAVILGIKTTFFPFPWMNFVVSFFWIILITNSFNLLDNMDGLSSGVAVISALIFFGIATVQGQFFMAMILAVFMGSVLGFLKYNYYPSSIFMGDAGSLFIGYVLATLTISASYVIKESATLLPALMPLWILSIPLFDTISVIIIRIKEKRPIYIGDKCHLSHRLVAMGFSQRNAINLIYLLTITIGLGAFLTPTLSVPGNIIIILQIILILIIISILMFVGKRNNKN